LFYYRFNLDQEIVAEKQKLLQKKAVLEVTEPIRKEMAAVQKRVATVKSVLAMQDAWKERNAYVLSKVTPDLMIDSLRFDADIVVVSGSSSVDSAIKDLFELYQSDSVFVSQIKEYRNALQDETIKTSDGKTNPALLAARLKITPEELYSLQARIQSQTVKEMVSFVEVKLSKFSKTPEGAYLFEITLEKFGRQKIA
jgi:hypothetical protein